MKTFKEFLNEETFKVIGWKKNAEDDKLDNGSYTLFPQFKDTKIKVSIWREILDAKAGEIELPSENEGEDYEISDYGDANKKELDKFIDKLSSSMSNKEYMKIHKKA